MWILAAFTPLKIGAGEQSGQIEGATDMNDTDRAVTDALRRLDLDLATHRISEVPIVPSGGGAPRTLPDLAQLAGLRQVPEMYPGTDVAGASRLGSTACRNVAAGVLMLDGRILDVERTIHVRAGVAIDGGWGGFRATPDFVGSEVVKTENTNMDYSAAGYARATSLINVVIDCGRRPGVRGLLQRNVQKDRVTGLRVRNCLADGWVVEGGYELFGLNFEIVAASQRDGGVAPAAGRHGLVCAATDCHFADGIAQHFAIGVHSPGAHNHFTRLHAWSTYHTGDPAMLLGFLDEGEGNTFIACNADSPRLGDNARHPSRENGGYGFFGDAHSMNRRIIACTVQLSQFGDSTSLPPANTIIPSIADRFGTRSWGLRCGTTDKPALGPMWPRATPTSCVKPRSLAATSTKDCQLTSICHAWMSRPSRHDW
jgi:hypothetical protein